MAPPVTGPFTESKFVLVAPGDTRYSYYSYQQSWKQAKPRNQPLSYVRDVGHTLARNGDNTSVSNWFISETMHNPSAILAYERYKNSFSPNQASLGVTLLEGRQSLSMIATRALQLANFVRALKRGRLDVAADIVGMVNPPPTASRRKHWSNNYLEFHLGWAPLVGDIYSAVNVLQSPFDNVRMRGRASDVGAYTYTPPNNFSQGWSVEWKASVQYGSEAKISNPNLYLANKLGLTNPLQWAVELIPFSFVGDWFFNVNQFLTLGTDFVGMTIINPYTTVKNEAIIKYRWRGYPWTSTVRQVRVRRSLGIAQPSFGLRQTKLWGWRRAASAVALLVQQFAKK